MRPVRATRDGRPRPAVPARLPAGNLLPRPALRPLRECLALAGVAALVAALVLLVAPFSRGASAPGGAAGPAPPPAALPPAPTALPGSGPPGPGPSLAAADPAAAPVTGPPPTAIAIPTIGVTSPVVRLGTTADGSLEAPGDYAVAGWYAAGPAPGALGPAVLAGHVDSTTGPAVFYRLAELRPGDEVLVRRADGTTASFGVTGVERVAKAAFPTAAVYGPVPGAELRLITCGGDFDPRTGSYRDNIVVFASAR